MPRLSVILVEPAPLNRKPRHIRRRLAASIDGQVVVAVVLVALAFGVGVWSAQWVFQPGKGYVRTEQAMGGR